MKNQFSNVENLFIYPEVWDTERHFVKAYQELEHNRPTKCILHHTWKPAATQFKGALTIKGILDYHLGRGWAYIGYHYLISPDGQQIFVGRPDNTVGSHAGGETPRGAKRLMGNTGSIGVCLIGNYDEEAPTEQALTTLNDLFIYLAAKHKFSVKNVFGHCEVFTVPSKTCPGKNLFVPLLGEERWKKLRF